MKDERQRNKGRMGIGRLAENSENFEMLLDALWAFFLSKIHQNND